MANGKRWFTRDQYGNEIYLTEERWEHIIDPMNHPELEDFEEAVQETIESGQRKHDTLSFHKYRYSRAFDALPEYNTHIVAIVLFRFTEGTDGKPYPNNYIVTAYMKEVG